jgi:hypothetical protein
MESETYDNMLERYGRYSKFLKISKDPERKAKYKAYKHEKRLIKNNVPRK